MIDGLLGSVSFSDHGYEAGQPCNRNGCKGVMKEHAKEGCSCHISPPCSSCTAPRSFCEACDWDEAEEVREIHMNDYKVMQDKGTGTFVSWKRRELDPSKIDYFTSSHTNSSQICEGVYPEGTTQADVLARVKGTFGGRFERFGGGHFKYIAYTD